MPKRAYEILGIDPTASDAEVRAAYRRLAQIYHPDRLGTAGADIRREAEQRMMELNAAFAEICSVRPARSAREEDLPSGWRASWDKVWQQEERWQEELERRRQEDRRRRVIHQRWEQIEKVTRRRAQAWAEDHPNPEPEMTRSEDAAVSAELPLPRPASNESSRLQELGRAIERNDYVRQAREAAARLRKTIDLDDTGKEKKKTAGRGGA